MGESKYGCGAFYGLAGDVAVVGVWRALSADQLPPPVGCAVPQCPWGGTYLPATDECQYTFNAQQRKAAAEWAISWAGKACPLFCTFQFDPYKDFSNWITGTPMPTDSQSRCGWDPDTASDLTDCANFVSQAYFSAGLPLHRDWYCEFSTSAPICIRGNTLGYAGWAWAGRNNGLPQYLRERGGVDTFQTGIDSLLNANPHPDNLLHSWKSLSEAPNPEPIPSNIESLMNLLSSQGFGRGDIIYTYNENPLPFRHVFLVVGWGPYVETWAQLEQVNLAASLVPTRPPNSDYVLYVVDHGPQGLFALKTPNTLFAGQLIGAKPYYASRWFTQNNLGDRNWVSGSRNLVTMPHLFSVSLSSIIPSDTQTISLKTSLPSVCPPIFVLQQ